MQGKDIMAYNAEQLAHMETELANAESLGWHADRVKHIKAELVKAKKDVKAAEDEAEVPVTDDADDGAEGGE